MIEKEKWYTLNEIVKNGLIPFSSNYKTIKGYVDRKYIKANTIAGTGNGKRYFIKGKDLIDFLEKWENGHYRV